MSKKKKNKQTTQFRANTQRMSVVTCYSILDTPIYLTAARTGPHRGDRFERLTDTFAGQLYAS